MVENDTICAGHITVLPNTARITLYRALDDEGHLMHVQYELSWEDLEQVIIGPEALCETTLKKMVEKLNGDPCTG